MGGKLIYVKVLKVLCGLLKSELPVYKNIVKYLEDYLLETNSYYQCLANVIIYGK